MHMSEKLLDDEILMVSEYEDVLECPLCKNEKREIYKKSKNYQLLKCAKCELVYQTPRKKDSFLDNQYVNNVTSRHTYYESTFLSDKLTFTNRLKNAIEYIGINPEGKTILDIGCNIGSFLSAAKDLGLNPVGVEPNTSAAEYCNERGYKVVNDFFKKDYFAEAEQFDIVHLGDITEHVANPAELMKDVQSVVKPGGYVIISTPNIDSYIARMFQIKPNEHILYFSETSLRNLINLSGMKVVKSFTTSRKRNINSMKFSTSFNTKLNRLILQVVNFFQIGEFATVLLKCCAKDEIFFIAKNEN